jgi:hypothetical protein
LVIFRSAEFQRRLKKTLAGIKASFLAKGEKEKLDGSFKEKLRVFVFKSRHVYGVCDQVSKLEYGQCHLRLTINGVPKTITG